MKEDFVSFAAPREDKEAEVQVAGNMQVVETHRCRIMVNTDD